ncbi:hypothetical protein SDC9_184775 [bioreactor metagenome]|uniref:Trp operon repressor n=1 Tax=bioreactor metagenome TaxID=1076179 RepID=A0A645HGF9_9ZZZZ|nr:YerC/YecD family TrpR-related protein [Candidatus Pelethousia sp.]NCB30228.1 hypothetical protein [Clostridia bacterium]
MYHSKMESPMVDRLFEALLTLKDLEDYYRFFDDVATVGEIQALAQRLQVAELLDKGERYTAIAERTGASTATISRVNKCLLYGADGYKAAIARLKKQE